MDENEEESGSESSLDEEKSWEKQLEKLGNPMADDYQNPSKNSYKYNNFDVEQEPGYLNRVKALGIPTGTKLYSLNIKHVLPAFNQKGMENIFREYGEILECKVARLGPDASPTDKTWATVKFASKMEAANALAALNGKPPFNFSVSWCISKETKEKRKKEMIRDKNYASKFNELMKNDELKKADELDWKKPENMHEKINNELMKQMKEEKRPDSEESGGMSNSERGTDESSKRKRTKKQKSDDYEFNPDVDTKPKEFGRPLFLETFVQEACADCNQEGRMICSRCGTWYCSLACQEKHWVKHKEVCVEVPSNLERRLSEVSLNDSEDEGEELFFYGEEQFNHGSKLEESSKPKHKPHETLESETKDGMELEPMKESVEQPTQELVPKTKLEAIYSNPLFKKIAVKPKAKSFLSLGEPTQVRVIHVVNPDEFYILPESSRKTWETVLVNIQKQPEGVVSQAWVGANTGLFCVAKDEEGIWFRSRIEEVCPNGKVKVFCIDFGTTKIVGLTDLKPLVKHSDIDGLVLKVRLDGITPTNDYWNNDQIKIFGEIVDAGGETKFKVTLIEKNQKGDLIVKLEDDEDNDVSQLCLELGIASTLKPLLVSKLPTCEESVSQPPPSEKSPSVPKLPPKIPSKSKPPPCAESFLTTFIKGSKILLAKDAEAPFTIFGGSICMYAEDMDYIFNELQEEAQSFRDRGFKSSSPHLKSWVVAYNPEEEFFSRGFIIGVNPPDTYNVLLIDFCFSQKFKGEDLLDMWPDAEKDKARGVRVKNTMNTSESEIRAHFEKNVDEMGHVEGKIMKVAPEGFYLKLTDLKSLFLAKPWYNSDPKAKALFTS